MGKQRTADQGIGRMHIVSLKSMYNMAFRRAVTATVCVACVHSSICHTIYASGAHLSQYMQAEFNHNGAGYYAAAGWRCAAECCLHCLLRSLPWRLQAGASERVGGEVQGVCHPSLA